MLESVRAPFLRRVALAFWIARSLFAYRPSRAIKRTAKGSGPLSEGEVVGGVPGLELGAVRETGRGG